MARRLTKLALAVTLAFGFWKGADACVPDPKVTPTFNEQATPAVREYRDPALQLPDTSQGQEVWRIRLGSWEMSCEGHHTFLEFSKLSPSPAPDEIYQIHGIAMDVKRHDFAQLDFRKASAYSRYMSGDYALKAFGVNQDHNRKVFGKEPQTYTDVFYGTKDEVLRKYMDALKMADEINRRGDDYRLIEHNSNSVQRSLLEGLGLKVPALYEGQLILARGMRTWAPGMESGLNLGPQPRGDYEGLSGAELEKAARSVSGVAKLWTPPPKP
ncbi:MAG: hypothetical protein ACAH80_11285 [Alphaproteobacteria bacterium]